MVVLKFGGSSVATPEALARVAAIVGREQRPRVVVVSALKGVTDELLGAAAQSASGHFDAAEKIARGLVQRHARMAAEFVRDATRLASLNESLAATWAELEVALSEAFAARACPPSLRDRIAAAGELASSRLVAAAFTELGVASRWVDARRVVVTNGAHGQAAPQLGASRPLAWRELRRVVEAKETPVVGGFVGATPDGATTTLGRGGSDFSASFVAACLGAEEVQIWTDVDGMLTADPRVFKGGQPVGRLSYDEAATLARFGAKVLHPSTVEPAIGTGIAVRILNSQNPEARGTLITGRTARRRAELAGIASRNAVSILDVTAPAGTSHALVLARSADACEAAGVTMHLAALTDSGASIVVDAGAQAELAEEAVTAAGRVERRNGLALVAVVGDALARNPLLCAAALRTLEGIPLHGVTQPPGAGHLAFVVPEGRVAQATARLHARFFERPARAAAVDHRPQAATEPVEEPLPELGREAWA
jgi:aspartate kinase